MKNLSPTASIAAIAVVLIVIGAVAWKLLGETRHDGEKPPGMPADVARQMAKVMQRAPAAARAAPGKP